MVELYIKRFDDWNEYKKILNNRNPDFSFEEKEIWWTALGVNIGSEQDGKNVNFERPVLIMRKVNRDRLLIVPITSKIEAYTDRFSLVVGGVNSQILLSQMRTISSKRLLRKIQRIKTATFLLVLVQLVKFMLTIRLESETPPVRRGISEA